MTVEIISVGTELLLGNIVNTNTAYLARQCAGLGLSCYYQTVVGDNKKRLTDALFTAYGRSDIIILGGGLGPTDDDLTKETVAEALNIRLVEDTETLKDITYFFETVRHEKMPENNKKQALVFENGIILKNDNGTAPGLIYEKEGRHIILLPGPPNEMIPMFENYVTPYLRKLNNKVICSKMVKIVGVGESRAVEIIKDMIDGQTNPTIAPYAKTGQVHFRVTALADSKDEGEALLSPVVSELYGRFGNKIYTTEESVSLEEALVKMLLKKGLTVTTAESCTGGLVGAALVNVPGASGIYREGYITYSNEAKHRLLNVSLETLENYGAVSRETAEEMAVGAANAADADVSVAITGIAGPDGGTKDKPVGLVYISCFCRNKNGGNGKKNVVTEEYRFSGSRMKIRESAVVRALDIVRRSV